MGRGEWSEWPASSLPTRGLAPALFLPCPPIVLRFTDTVEWETYRKADSKAQLVLWALQWGPGTDRLAWVGLRASSRGASKQSLLGALRGASGLAHPQAPYLQVLQRTASLLCTPRPGATQPAARPQLPQMQKPDSPVLPRDYTGTPAAKGERGQQALWPGEGPGSSSGPSSTGRLLWLSPTSHWPPGARRAAACGHISPRSSHCQGRLQARCRGQSQTPEHCPGVSRLPVGPLSPLVSPCTCLSQDSRWVFLKASPLHLEGPLPGCRPMQLASHCLILQPPQPCRAPGVGGPFAGGGTEAQRSWVPFLGRIRHVICGTQGETKMKGPCSKIVKNFKTAKHSANCGPF